MTKRPTLNAQQLAFLDRVRSTFDNLQLSSPAGSGKTFITIEAAGVELRRGRTVLLTSFAKRNVNDLSERAQPGVACRTFNSLGHAAWGRRIGKRLELRKYKAWDIAKAINLDIKDRFPDFPRALGLCKAAGVVPPKAKMAGQGLVPATDENIAEIVYRANLDDGDIARAEMTTWVCAGLIKSIEMAWEGQIDFDDQLYMPALFQGDFPRYDTIFIDEYQDVSPIQRAMLRRMGGPRGSRIIAVGDPYQAIYAFRGADTDSVTAFAEEFGCEKMFLSVSFRCPQAVVAEARKLVPHIEACPDAPVGQVRTLKEWGPAIFDNDSAILCRNVKPLIPACFALLQAGHPAVILGRDIGKGLSALIKKLKSPTVTELRFDLTNYHDTKVAEWSRSGKEAKIRWLEDQIGSIFAIIQGFPTDSISDLLTKIEEIFDDSKGPITLSTIHKAKGLEWSRVAVLDRWRMPSKFATTPEELTQERNIEYVAVTRAKSSLFFIPSEHFDPNFDPTPGPTPDPEPKPKAGHNIQPQIDFELEKEREARES